MTALKSLKEAQLALILKHNPMTDDIHLGIRKLSDIKTFAEVVNDDESFVYGDYSQQDALNALKAGTITVYSSKSINIGDFVSTSHRMAKDYAGSGRVNQRTVKLTDVAWINGDEGVYTGPIKIKEEKKMSIKIESSVELSKVLEATLSKLVSKYYPSGVIEVAPDLGARHTGVLSAKFIPEDTTYAPLVIGIVDDKITRLGSRFNRDTDPKIIAFKEVFNKAQARVADKAKAPSSPAPAQAPSQGIHVIDGNLVSKVLLDKIITTAKNYCPQGTLTIGKLALAQENARRFNQYAPADISKPPILIASQLNNIVAVGALYPDDTSNKNYQGFIGRYTEAQVNEQYNKYSEADRRTIDAVRQLAKYRGQPLVIRYRESTRRVLVYAGGGLQHRKDKPPVWNGQGEEISELIAKAVNNDDHTEEGVNVEVYYTHGYTSGKGDGLIAHLNRVSGKVLGADLFDKNKLAHVNARGTLL